MPARNVRTALITGAAGTLGAAISENLARRGYAVALADTNSQATNEVHARIQKSGGESCELQLDVTCQQSWLELRSQLQARWSRLDMLVNNAGTVTVADFADLEWSEWERVMNVNLHGTALGCHTMANWLGEGSDTSYVMNVASYTGLVPIPWSAAYTVSKAAIVGLSEALAVEWASHDISVTTVCPGFFASGLFDQVAIADASLAAILQKAVSKSTLTAEQVARQAVHGTLRRQPYVVMPASARWQWRMKRWLPSWFLARLARDSNQIRERAQQRLADGTGVSWLGPEGRDEGGS